VKENTNKLNEQSRLFVYGTLAPGRENHHLMRDIEGSWESATIRGQLISEGWGAAHGCPGVIPNENGEQVSGYLFTSRDLPQHWSMLDEFEGDDYRRVLVAVTVADGEQLNACVYAIRTDSG
jgi:gamma-glutamylcyclotransferase (GGCT)/AIG2-like uncharacterized protein YtfP